MRFAYRVCYYVIKRSYTVRRDTLQLNFLNYFRSSVEYKKITLQNWNSNFSNNEVLKNIRENSVVSSFSIEELSSTLYYLGKEQSSFGAHFCDRRASVDKACSDRLPNLSREEILILLDAWMYALPNRITFTNFYLLTLRRFDTWFRDKDLSLYEWVLCIFYIGLGKRRNQTLMTKAINYFDHRHLIKQLRKNRIRYNSRLCLLLSAVQIEAPHIVKDAELWREKNHLKIVNPNLDIHLKNRDAFMKVLEAVKNLASTLRLANVKWEFTVPHIYIAGITAESMNGYLINIEVLDSTLCLYESEFPEGLMKFKLRLSEALGYLNIIIQEKDVKKNLDTENLYSYIEDILRRVINNERWDVEH